MQFYNGNTNQAINIFDTGQNNAQGIVFQDEVNSGIVNPNLAEIDNEGVKIFHGSGTGCGGNWIQGGTSEGNGTGISIPNCGFNYINSLDLEADTVPLSDGSPGNHFVGVSAAQVLFLGTATDAVLEKSNLRGWTISSGANGVTVRDNIFNEVSATSVFHNNRSVNGGNFWPEQYGCQNGVTIQAGFNRVVETSGSANNAIA